MGRLDTVEVLRNHTVESSHRVAWCVVRDGALEDEGYEGAGRTHTFLRSAAKPLQAMAAIRAGVPEALGLEDRHVAIACASHGGWDEHVVCVTEILVAAGIDEALLGCGPDRPRDPVAAALFEGSPPSRIRHNCSGKHAMGMALCVQREWPLEGYWRTDHPLQAAMRAEMAADLGIELDDLHAAIDGCGMRTYPVALEALARAFAALPQAPADAMRAHPHLVAFPGAIDTELMRGVPGAVAKIGAEGVLAVGFPEQGIGLALKVLDGSLRALDPAGVGLVRGVLGLPAGTPELDALARPLLVNSRGAETGCLQLV